MPCRKRSKFVPLLATLLTTIALSLIACQRRDVNEPAPPSAISTTAPATLPAKEFAPVATEHLHNAHVVLDGKVLSGAQPDDEASFRTLQSLGVKTILSVDGAMPNTELAHKYGMRYVHLPIGYDGVSVEQGQQIAKALVEFAPAGPVYVHCHHGKHRSAAAVAVACVYSGLLKPERAESVLRTFGTGANYAGLWRAAREARPLAPGTLEKLQVEFVEQAKISDAAAHMVKIDEHFEHLKQVKAAGWNTPSEHPDLSPAHEALQLQEHFRESARLPDAEARPGDYLKQLADAERHAAALQRVLSAASPDLASADAAFKSIGASCVSCHKAYRD